MRAIIPCAGFGTRMGMKPNESKEMLFLNNEDTPCIDYALKQCAANGLSPLVVTRPEKKDLIAYCEELGVKLMLLNPKREWADTVLASRPYWDEDNVLLLPDTRWENPRSVHKIVETNCFTIGTHFVMDPQNWGIYEGGAIIEKPKETHSNIAWGIIKFEYAEGIKFFTEIADNKYSLLPKNHTQFNLGRFQDLTRVRL